jgi:hypothetical protein
MKRFQIHIEGKENQTRALAQVMRRGRITCLRDDMFVVPEPALDLLKDLAIPYTVVSEVAKEDPLGSIRGSVTAAV